MAGNDIGPRIGIDGEAEFKKSIAAVNAQMKALGAEMKAVTAEFAANAQSEEALTTKNDVLSRSVQTAKDALGVLDGQLDRQKQKLAALGAELDRVISAEGENSAAAAKAQNAYNQQYAVVGRLEAQYQSTRAQVAGFTNALTEAGDAAQEAGGSLAGDVLAGAAGWDMIQAAVRGTTQALREAVQTGMEFDASMSDVAATMGTSVDALGELRGFALEMGQSTVFSANQAAQALNYMALAGYDAQTSMEALPNVLNLAAAGGLELASASDMVTDAQSALGLSMEQTALLVDEMAKTSTRTNTSVGQLGEAILTVGGTAKFMAGGTAELNQVLGVLADNSIKGAEGGTKLRNIILSLTSPTEDAAKQLEELGVSVFDAEGNMREFSSVFPELQAALSRLTSQEQITALSEIFNSRDIAAAQALLGTTAQRWDELAAAIDGAQGSARQMAETRLDNLAGDLTLMQSAADGAKIALSDSLTPALRNAAQAGTGVLTFIGGFIQEVPLAGQALAGLAAAGVTLGAGAVAAAGGITSVTRAVTALTAAVASNPFGLLAIGVGTAVTALTAFSFAADEAGKKTTAAAQAVEESRAAFEEQGRAAAGQRSDVEALVSQLEELAGAEERSAGQKAQLLEVTEQLNRAVPGLGLEYDQLTDSLNMTTDQLLELTRAQLDAQERQQAAANVVQAERDRAQVVRELEQAQRDLAAAIQAKTDAENAGMAADLGSIEEMERLRDEVSAAQATVTELEGALEVSQQAVSEMETRLEELSQGAQEAGEGLEETAKGAEEASQAAQETAASMEELEEATLYAAGAADNLSDALKEQEKQGSLSYDTAQKLIEAGYGAAVAIDAESGAVTLNREEYIALAGAKIQEQLATLEAQRASVQAKAALAQEEMAAQEAAVGYYDLARAKAAAAYAEDIQALDLQIAALNRAQSSLGSYSGAVTSAARSSSRASKQIKTQAQKDLEEYKTLKAELDHEKNMGLTSEADYYRRLEELRDQYLADAGNLDEYRKVSETIYKADQKALQEREKLWQSAGNAILKLEEDFQNKLSQRSEQIADSYKLFDAVPEYQKTAGTELIANLEDQIAAIETFYGNVAALEERGVNTALVEDIRSMGVKASGELAGLLELTDEQLTRYSDLFGEKQELANRLAADELKSLREDTDQAILEQMNSVEELYDTNAPALGLSFSTALAQGMLEGMPQVEEMARNVAASAVSAFERAYNRDVEAMMTQPKQRVTSGDIGELLAGAVNGINTGGGGAVYPPVDVTLELDGQVLARRQVDPMRQAFRERPETLDD